MKDGKYVPETANLAVKLDSNEHAYGLPPFILEEIQTGTANLQLHRYPEVEAAGLKEQAARCLGVSKDMIVVGNGSNELVLLLVLALSRRCARVVVPRPTFIVYSLTSRAVGLPLVEVDLTAPDFGYPLEELLAAAGAGSVTRPGGVSRIGLEEDDWKRPGGETVFFLARPNNPTGNLLPRGDLLEILRTGHWVVVDEAYGDFSGETALPLIRDFPNLLLLCTLSKGFALAGCRVGFMVGDPRVISIIERLKLPYNVNLFSQFAASVVLKHASWFREAAREIAGARDALFDEMAAIPGITPFESKANFILFRVESGVSTPSGQAAAAEALWAALRERGISIRIYRGMREMEGFLRVTVGTPEENEKFIQELRDILGPGAGGLRAGSMKV